MVDQHMRDLVSSETFVDSEDIDQEEFSEERPVELLEYDESVMDELGVFQDQAEDLTDEVDVSAVSVQQEKGLQEVVPVVEENPAVESNLTKSSTIQQVAVESEEEAIKTNQVAIAHLVITWYGTQNFVLEDDRLVFEGAVYMDQGSFSQ